MVKVKPILSIVILFLFVLSGCTGTGEKKSQTTDNNILTSNWKDIVTKAKGTKVNFFMWGGDQGVNQYIDDWVAPQLKNQYNIEIKRYPMDASEFINKLITEKKAGN